MGPDVCRECRQIGINCDDFKRCQPVRDNDVRPYGGVRHTADGFDCALPVTIDSHSVCAYDCLFCFSDMLTAHADAWGKPIGETSIATIEGIFSGNSESVQAKQVRKALRYDRRNKQGYPCPVQLGGLCDPCDSIEQQSGWLLKFIDLAIKYNQPVRISTKGAIFLLPEYMNAIMQKPELFWVAFSMTTGSDELSKLVEHKTPPPSTRLKLMEKLSDVGVSTSLRFRPIIPNISDKNKGHEELIKRAGDAGAKAVSYEVMFYPSAIGKEKKWRWEKLDKYTGINLKQLYKSFGPMQACTRPSYTWTEGIMHRVKELAHDNGMVVGVSDPVWKQLTDSGCCCGILPNDPVFGNWEPENATNAMITAKKTGDLIYLKDITPPWAYEKKLSDMVNLGAGPLVVHKVRNAKWSDSLRDTWNRPSSQRGPVNYFQGAWEVHGEDENGDIVYRYKGLERQNIKTTWNI